MNIPNRLTVLRVALVPFFVVFMLTDIGGPANKYISLVLFNLASLTDLLDGYLARKNHLVTNFGKFMDPLADKLLVCSAMICLIPSGRLEAWIVLIIVAREFIISGFRLVASDNGVVIAASSWGKVKTVFQMIMINLVILDLSFLPFRILTTGVKWAAAALTVISLIDYIRKNRKVLSGNGM